MATTKIMGSEIVSETKLLNDYFEEFWAIFPNRKGKKAAFKAFEKACKGEDVAEFTKMICLAVEAQQRYRKEAQGHGEFIPNWKMPATWLNAGCWDDEIKSHAELKQIAEPLSVCCVEGCNDQVHGPKFDKCCYHYSRDTQHSSNTVTFDDLRAAVLPREQGEPISDYLQRCKQRYQGSIGK